MGTAPLAALSQATAQDVLICAIQLEIVRRPVTAPIGGSGRSRSR
jgi:hypothetical protein